MLKPTLRVSEVRIFRDSNVVYEASLHSGVNIIRGSNASGKTTIMDFIFYGLGGENIAWRSQALLCDSIVLEVFLNGVPICLRRPVVDKNNNPMAIFWGAWAKAEKASFREWETYPYSRSAAKESFSQVIFRAMGLPELRGESSSNITMHQLLRLMYSDQRTPSDEIFRSETWDTGLNREAIGNYLCGVFSAELYDSQVELRLVDSDLDKVNVQLRGIFAVLGKSGQESGNSTDFLRAESAAVNEEVKRQEQLLTDLKKNRLNPNAGDTAKRVIEVRNKLNAAQAVFANEQNRLANLELEIKDSKLFIEELERRLVALNDSHVARAYLGNLNFQFCPCCLGEVKLPADKQKCHLCTGLLEDSSGETQILRMQNELALQKKESEVLLKKRYAEINELKSKAPKLASNLKKLEKEFSAIQSDWSSPQEVEIEGALLRIGELNQRLRQLAEYHRLAEVLEDLQLQRSGFEAKKSYLQDQIAKLQGQNDVSKKIAKDVISESLIYLLKNDLPRQDEFIDAQGVDWNFLKNRVSVNGQTQFSESSMVILRHSFHLALLVASVKEEIFRFPRFLMIDGIEDGGQEPDRAYKFQRLLVDVCESLENEYQVIFATSGIEATLDVDEYVVGKRSTTEDKTLSIA